MGQPVIAAVQGAAARCQWVSCGRFLGAAGNDSGPV